MLDVARHFFSVDDVKRYIDELAYYKINRLHLHLTMTRAGDCRRCLALGLRVWRQHRGRGGRRVLHAGPSTGTL